MSDADILRFTRTPHPMPEGWLERWLGEFDQERRYGLAIVDDDGEFLGYAVTGIVDRGTSRSSSATPSRRPRVVAAWPPRRCASSRSGPSTRAWSA